jgi:hypothetical protein
MKKMNKMSKHTPGPWRWWETACGARVAGHPADGSKNFVCDVLAPERDVSYKANACLIAAAPELLKALEYVLEDDGLIPRATAATRAVVRAAIDKAIGETK